MAWRNARSTRVDPIFTSRDSTATTVVRRVSFVDVKSFSSFQSDAVGLPKKKPALVRQPTGFNFMIPKEATEDRSTPEPQVEDCEDTTEEDEEENEAEEQDDILLARAMAHAVEHARTKGESFVWRKPQQRPEERSKAEYLASEALARMGCVGFPVKYPRNVVSQSCSLM